MNYPIKTDSTYVSRIIFNETSEQTVDSDFGLPDYCPDIQKILKCRIEPQIDSRNITADRIEIEGTAVVRIIYVDAIKMSVRCTEQSFPYSITSNLKSAPDNAVIQTDIKVSYLNCRALSPRRLNIHGAFNVGIKVIERCSVRTVNHIKGSDIQQKKTTLPYSRLDSVTNQQFTVTETLEQGQGRAAIQSVIRSDVIITKGETNSVSGKLMYKGELLVKLLYLTDLDHGKTDSMEYSIPFSQVIDLGNITGASKIAVRSNVMSHSISLRSEIGFDDPLPVLNAKISLTAFAFTDNRMTMISDCYSTLYDVKQDTEEISLPALLAVLNENIVEKTNVDLTDNTAVKVIDVWCESGAAVFSRKDNKPCLCGKYNICILAVDSEDNIFYTERSSEFSHIISLPDDCDDITAYLENKCVSAGFRICSDKRIEVRAEMCVTGEIYAKHKEKCVTSLTSDESSPKKNDFGTVVLYFADRSESVWDIARQYCTSAEKIISENELEEDILSSPRILMITA